jgi:hypothetical protein
MPNVPGRILTASQAASAGGGVTINTSIDARGADPSLLTRLGPALDRRDQQLVARIGHMMRRGDL